MKKLLAPLAAAVSLIVLVPAAANAQSPASAARSAAATSAADPAKLAEAKAIIAVAFPPAQQQQMMDSILNNIMGPMRAGMSFNGIDDPGFKAIVNSYMDQMVDAERPLIMKHLPAMLDATAIAYSHQFSLAELKDIHAFAITPSGRDFLSHSSAVLGDPAVKEANIAMATESRALAQSKVAEFREKLTAYVKAHPELAAKLEAQSNAQAK